MKELLSNLMVVLNFGFLIVLFKYSYTLFSQTAMRTTLLHTGQLVLSNLLILEKIGKDMLLLSLSIILVEILVWAHNLL